MPPPPLAKPQAQQDPLAPVHIVGKVPYASYPHMIETIVAHSVYKTLLAFRATCSSLKALADLTLCDNDSTLHITLGHTSDGEEFVLRNSFGVLPFGQDEWASVLKRSKKVEVDGCCLSAAMPSPFVGPGDSVSEAFNSHHKKTQRRLGLLEALKKALDDIHLTTPVTVTHNDHHPPPEYLPPVTHLTMVVDPLCNCYRIRQSPLPDHSASRVTLVLCSSWSNSSTLEERPCCGLVLAITTPSLDVLVISAESYTQVQTTTPAIWGPRGKFNRNLQVEFRFRNMPDEVLRHDFRRIYASYFGLTFDQVQIVRDPTAGIVWPEVD